MLHSILIWFSPVAQSVGGAVVKKDKSTILVLPLISEFLDDAKLLFVFKINNFFQIFINSGGIIKMKKVLDLQGDH